MEKEIQIKNINFNKDDISNGINYYTYNYQNHRIIIEHGRRKA